MERIEIIAILIIWAFVLIGCFPTAFIRGVHKCVRAVHRFFGMFRGND